MISATIACASGSSVGSPAVTRAFQVDRSACGSAPGGATQPDDCPSAYRPSMKLRIGIPIGLSLRSSVEGSKSRKRPFGSSAETRSDHGQRGHAAARWSGVCRVGLVQAVKVLSGSCVLSFR